MTDKEKAKAYDEALERARKMLNMILDNELLGFPDQIREIFPQLRENEDEKMLREIKRYIKEQGDKPTGLPNGTVAVADMIAYLEKQKVKVYDDTPYYTPEEVNAKIEKPTDVIPKIPRQEYLYHLLANGVITFSDYEFLMRNKGRKPADLSEMMVHKEPYIAPVPTPIVADEQKSAECIDFYDEFYKVYTGPKNILAYVNIFVKKLGYVPIDIHELSACVYYVIKHIEEDTKASQKEQKPSEWSEEDSLHLANAILSAEKEWGNESCTAKWLKSLPERFNLQSKQEWSEEDEMYLSQAIETLEHECYSCLADKLKSLRPQPKCEIYKSAKHDLAIRFMNYLDENRPKGKMSLSNDECEDIDKAFRENDWAKILMYAEKYGKKN